MRHLVLARKYRPRSFDQVVGQDVIVKTLQSALQKGRIAHAMLFTGGRGIGKTTIARIVAKALVCLNRTELGPCGTCVQCVAIDNFSSLDVVEIDGASHTGVDDIRELRDSTRYQPTSAAYKIFIIDEVHMLSLSAFNALLKILEEPPPHVVFILATTEVHKIPKTILSRCQRYDFKRVSKETIFLALKDIVAREAISVDDDGLRLVASLADGSMRDSQSLAEQVFADAKEHYTADDVANALGVVSSRAVNDLCDALINHSVPDALVIVKDVYEKGFDLCQLMEAVTERFRALSLCAHVEREQVSGILDSIDDSDIAHAQQLDKNDLKRLFAMALDGMSQVFQAQRPLFAMELFVLRAALRPALSDAATISYCLQKLDAIMHSRPLPDAQPSTNARAPERGVPLSFSSSSSMTVSGSTSLSSLKDASPKPFPTSALPESGTAKTRVDLQKPQAPATKSPSTNKMEMFGTLVRTMSTKEPALASHLRHARPEFDGEGVVKLYFEQSLHYEQIQAPTSYERVRAAIKATFGSSWEPQCVLQKNQPTGLKNVKTVAEIDADMQIQEKKALLERAHSNPLVKKALEIFGGDITEVKRVTSSST